MSSLGFQSLEELDGSYLYIAASVVESMGKLLSDWFQMKLMALGCNY